MRGCFCPSCSKKRQVAFAEFVTEQILEDVPYRHANFTVPGRLRRHFYFNRKLLSKLARQAYETLREAVQEACGPVTPGAVSVVHTAGSLLDFRPPSPRLRRAGPHVHLIITSGGWLESGVFVHAPPLPREALERLFQHRVFRLLLDEGAVSADVVEDMLQWHPTGFAAYIGHEIDGEDKHALEYLGEYMAKGPISLDKLNYAEDTGKTSYRSTKTHPRHGAYRDFDPLQFLADLTAHIARPYERVVNYHGRFSNRSRGFQNKHLPVSCPTDPEVPCARHTSPRRASWARLIQRVYEVDPLACPP